MGFDERSEPGIRLFFAIGLASPAKEALHLASQSWQKELPFARWYHPDDLHVTVKFIGDVRPGLADELLSPVREAVSRLPAFELKLGGLGVFGRPDAPEVLWCGVQGTGLDALGLLHTKTEEAAVRCGIAPETRPYRPHITVARKYRGARPFSRDMLAAASSAPPAAWTVQELVLYYTHFGRRPAYEALAKLPLEGN